MNNTENTQYKKNTNVIFMGADSLSCPFLSALVNAPDVDVAAVVTQPDHERGRHKRVLFNVVKELATSTFPNIPVYDWKNINDAAAIEVLKSYTPDVIVVVAYGQFLKQPVLDIPKLGCLNMHVSLLPELRGAAPIQHAIIRGYTETGVTGMMMDIGMDTGDILKAVSTPIADEDTAESLQKKLVPLGTNLMLDTIRRLNNGTARRTPQDHTKATLAPKIHKEDSLINWNVEAIQIVKRIRALNIKPVCRFSIKDFADPTKKGLLIKVKNATVEQLPDDLQIAPAPGTIISMRHGIIIAAGDGFGVRLLEVLPEGRKGYMSGVDFANGYNNKIIPGEQVYQGI